MSNPISWLYSQLLVTPTKPTKSCEGKIVIVTGANVGLGLEAARHFVRLKASKVILAVRTLSKGTKAKESIECSESCSKDVIEVWPLDLASFDSVKAFANKMNDLPRLDVLLENAGIATNDFCLSEGHESTITANVISTFLLALYALPKLKMTARTFNTKPYLTIVSSDVHFWTDLPERKNPNGIFNTLDAEENGMEKRYEISKLIEILVVREIVETIIKDKDSYPVIINLVNPGLCRSNLLHDIDSKALSLALRFLARTTTVGSRSLVYAAGEIGEHSMGQFISDCKVTPPSAFVRSEEGRKTQSRVWMELREILESIHPGVTDNI